MQETSWLAENLLASQEGLCFTQLIDWFIMVFVSTCVQWRTEGGFWGLQPPHPEIPKALQNRAKLNPIVKTVKNCWI